MLTLHPFQAELVARLRAAYAGGARSVLLQSPTGAGKTTMAADILGRVVRRGRKALFVAHLSELVRDTRDRLQAAGIRAGVIQASVEADPSAPVQVCSLQTLHARELVPDADFIAVDEAHRSASPTLRGLLERYPAAKLLGLSGTPQRADGAPLDVFQVLVPGPSVEWLMSNGFLVPADTLAPSEYLDSALADDPVAAYQRHTPGQRGICFAANVKHAQDLAARFNAAGFASVCITGETAQEDREQLRERVTRGEIRVVVNVAVAVEGFDLPALEVVILARGFTTVCAYLQACGRGLRTSPTTQKARLTILDLRGAVHLHGLVEESRQWSLDGTAVRRLECMTALRRCKTCMAIFRPAAACPRCGARAEALARIPRVLSRAEKLQRISALPQHERDAKYLARLEHVARARIGMPEHRVEDWARTRFVKQFGREPERKAA
jgi:DNA repair protein RadD